MQIKNMFEKQIDRDIKGVIKVGQSDEENVWKIKYLLTMNHTSKFLS